MHHLFLSHSHTTVWDGTCAFTCVWSWCTLNPSSVSAFIHALALYVHTPIYYRGVSWCCKLYNCHFLPLCRELWVWAAHACVFFLTPWCPIHPQLIGILACAMMLLECMLDVGYCSCAVKDCMKRLWHYIAMGEPRLHFNVQVQAKVLWWWQRQSVFSWSTHTHGWVKTQFLFNNSIRRLCDRAETVRLFSINTITHTLTEHFDIFCELMHQVSDGGRVLPHISNYI